MTFSNSQGIIRGMMASPHPTEGRCFYEDCGGPITDIWAEFMETIAEKAAVSLGKADFTCPYCDRSLRFDPADRPGTRWGTATVSPRSGGKEGGFREHQHFR